MKKCTVCNKELEDSWKVCPYCGTDIPTKKTCFHCGKQLEEGWQCCPFCGGKSTVEGVSAIVDGLKDSIDEEELQKRKEQRNDADPFVIENGVLTYYRGAGGEVVIPDGVKEIGDGAFAYCTELTGVKIPESVTKIGFAAFSNCVALDNVVLPKGIKSIDGCAFEYCASLKSIALPYGMKSVSEYAFWNCASLQNVVLPASIEEIEHNAFTGCKSLAAINLPNSLYWIYDGAFSESGLISIVIPRKTGFSVEDNMFGCPIFNECERLKTIYCEIEKQPADWSDDWKGCEAEVVWGYKI